LVVVGTASTIGAWKEVKFSCEYRFVVVPATPEAADEFIMRSISDDSTCADLGQQIVITGDLRLHKSIHRMNTGVRVSTELGSALFNYRSVLGVVTEPMAMALQALAIATHNDIVAGVSPISRM